MRILIIEDDPEISLLLKMSFEKEYDIDIAHDSQEAMFDLIRHIEDVILLDLGLPDMDGQELLKKIREFNTSIPIIVVSARSGETDKVTALNNGADDYVTKPFSINELSARIRVILKRNNKDNDQPRFENGAMTIDFLGHQVYLDGHPIKLTNYEFKILALLAKNLGKTLTHSFIVTNIWGSDDGTSSLRVLVSSLRKKIEKDPFNPKYIQTDSGIGYRMVDHRGK